MEFKTPLLLILIIAGLASQTAAWSINFITKTLVPLSKLAMNQELVWFLSQQMTTEQSAELDKFMKIMAESTGLTQTVITNNTQMRMMRAPAKRNHLSLLFTTGIDDPIMEVINRVLIGRHFYFVFMILAQRIDQMQPVYDICRFMYNHNYINTLLYFESIYGVHQFFGISRFPNYKIENRTDFWGYMRSQIKRIQNAVSDVEGYRFSSPLRQDLPHLFKFQNRFGNQRYEGTTYRIMKTFVELINGSLVEYTLPPDAHGGDVVNMKQVLDLVRTKQIEFSAHSYALFHIDDEIDKTYPMLVVKWCLMVPLYNSVSTYFYPLKPFDWTVWFFVIGVFFALGALELAWLFYRHRTGQHFDFLPAAQASLLDNFCYILNIAATKPLKYPSTLRFLLLVAVFFHGFFLTANYTSLLGSILTVNIFRAQINTMDDIINAELPVMIIDYELEFLLAEGYELPPEFKALLRAVDSSTFAQHQTSFNTSFAYFVTEDHWSFLDGQQEHLQQRVFKFSDICFGSYHLTFPIQMDSSLWRDLEYYIFRVHSSGLLNYYERSTFEEAIHAKIVSRLPQSREYTSAGLRHLIIAFVYLGVMCALSGICLLLEIMWFRLTLKRQRVQLELEYVN